MKQNVFSWAIPFKTVFRKPGYSMLAVGIAAAVLLLAIWLPNIQFIVFTITTDIFSFGAKVRILVSFLGMFQTNFNTFSRIVALIVSVVSGVNIALVVYYFRRRVQLQHAAGASLFGILGGLVGVGCASCGSIVLSTLFGVSATASFLNVLPFHGAEIGILSIFILLGSTIWVARKISDPLVCAIEPHKRVRKKRMRASEK